MQTESCGFIINGVIVKDEENVNYYPARRYMNSAAKNNIIAIKKIKISYVGIEKYFKTCVLYNDFYVLFLPITQKLMPSEKL